MCALNISQTRDLLAEFNFHSVFIRQLGWSQPASRRAVEYEIQDTTFKCEQIAELSGAVVLEITSPNGIPNASLRAAVHKRVSQSHFENIIIFVDSRRTQSLWYWVNHENGKRYPREHLYVKGQPGDLFISKISSMVFDISRFEEGDVSILEVAESMRRALDVERVTKRFYDQFKDKRCEFIEFIHGIDDPTDRQWYASILMHRLMFIFFLQKKFFLNRGDEFYLDNKLKESQDKFGPDCYYKKLLHPLFFEGFAKPSDQRSPQARELLGEIVYLNGGLFLPHRIEEQYPDIDIPDEAFRNLLELFNSYSWNLDDTPGGRDNEINPDVLGYIFEKYINQKAFGAYYTRTEITEYLCEHTIHQIILDKVNPECDIPGLAPQKRYESLPDMLMDLDSDLCRRLLHQVLPNLSILDPACGSGAFLVAAMKTLINIYSAVTGKIEYLTDQGLKKELADIRDKHKSINYHIKREIITKNLFGVDIMDEACEIAKLRLFLALVSSAQSVDELEPLPNIDFNILPGNSLIGLLRVDDEQFNKHNSQGNLFRKNYRQVVNDKNRLIDLYRNSRDYQDHLHTLRDEIQSTRQEAIETLDDILLDEFSRLGIKYEQATWDTQKGAQGKPSKRDVTLKDIKQLKPFHWGYEFDKTINESGGFDVIITNPPWEVFQTDEKEFFQQFEPTIQKKKLRIEDWKKQRVELMNSPIIRDAWLEYAGGYPFASAFFKSAPQYENQISLINGRNAGSKINLYSYFTEQCFNLLRDGGQCGIVIPSGIYTDLGAKQLREMLFSKTRVTGLFGFENRKSIFEGVDGRFKFVVLTYGKGGSTTSFPAAFMRHEVSELVSFPRRGSLSIPVNLIRRLSPDSLSVMEFKEEIDVEIAEKMLRFPLLGESVPGSWSVRLTTEFNMTTSSHLFRTSPGPTRLPLYEGKMIHQFDHQWAKPRYWIEESEARRALFGRSDDDGSPLDYQSYRLAYRSVASNTNNRTMIMTVLHPGVFAGNSIIAGLLDGGAGEVLTVAGMLNSFVVDYVFRKKVTTNCNMFYVYQLPIPRLTEKDAVFGPIVDRAARLICTTPEFDDLAAEVGLGTSANGATDPAERARLRAELDGLVAHLYGVTEAEFSHILSTFPAVDAEIKAAAMDAYRDVGSGSVR